MRMNKKYIACISWLIMVLMAFTLPAGCAKNGGEGAAEQAEAATEAATAATVATTAATTASTAPAITEEIGETEIDAAVEGVPGGSGGGGAGGGSGGGGEGGLEPVATVAGIAISQPEYRFLLNSYKSGLLLNSGIAAGTDEDVNFWVKTSSNGKTRLDEAREIVLTELHRLKICEAIAENRGIGLEEDELGNISTDLKAQSDRFGGRENFEKILSDEYGADLFDYINIKKAAALRDKLLDSEREALEIVEADIKNIYDMYRDQYGDIVVIRQILFLMEGADYKSQRTEEESAILAEEALAAIEAGADMAALVREKSEEPNAAASGGERAVTKADEYVPAEVLEWAFGAGVGDCAVVGTSFGYYVVRLEGRIERQYEDVKHDVESVLRELKLEALVAEWLANPVYALVVNNDVIKNIV